MITASKASAAQHQRRNCCRMKVPMSPGVPLFSAQTETHSSPILRQLRSRTFSTPGVAIATAPLQNVVRRSTAASHNILDSTRCSCNTLKALRNSEPPHPLVSACREVGPRFPSQPSCPGARGRIRARPNRQEPAERQVVDLTSYFGRPSLGTQRASELAGSPQRRGT